jgi:hypothetical protein
MRGRILRGTRRFPFISSLFTLATIWIYIAIHVPNSMAGVIGSGVFANEPPREQRVQERNRLNGQV